MVLYLQMKMSLFLDLQISETHVQILVKQQTTVHYFQDITCTFCIRIRKSCHPLVITDVKV